MQVWKADLGLEDTAEVGTGGGPVRAAIKNPPNEVLPAHRGSSESFLVCFVLARPGKYQRGAIFEHRGKISAVYAQTVGWTPTVRVEA